MHRRYMGQEIRDGDRRCYNPPEKTEIADPVRSGRFLKITE